jgi:hypothetical protein
MLAGLVSRQAFVACIGVAVLFCARSAFASASARLVYVRGHGAEQCPPEAAVHAAVSTRLGYDPFFAWARDSLFVEITRTGDEYHAEIKLVNDENDLRGDRDLGVKSDDCSAMIDALGLTISLTIDPSSLVGSASPPPAAQPPPLAPAEPPAAPTEPPLPPAPPRPVAAEPDAGPRRDQPRSDLSSKEDRLESHAGVGGLGVVGAEPSPSAGGLVLLGISWRMFSLDIEGRADLPVAAASETLSARVQSSLLTGSFVPCLHLGVAFGCPVLEVGVLRATSIGTAAPHPAEGTWAALGGRIGVDLPIWGRWFLRGFAELLGTMRRDTLSIDGASAYTYPVASAGVGAALVVRFP